MSDDTTFLTELRALMQRIPTDLTATQLEWALKETPLALGSKLTCIELNQHQQDVVPNSGPRN